MEQVYLKNLSHWWMVCHVSCISGCGLVDSDGVTEKLYTSGSVVFRIDPSANSLHTNIIPLSNDYSEGYVFANLHITGTISPQDNRIYEQVFLTFSDFFGKEKTLNVKLYGTLERIQNWSGISFLIKTLTLTLSQRERGRRLNRSYVQSKSKYALNVVFLLNGERVERELPCVYLVNKEKLQ